MADDQSWVLQVGLPFVPGVHSWPERFEYRVFGGQHMLQLCAGALTPQAIKAFHEGAVHLGLYLYGGVVFVLFQIEGLYAWSDQAFSMGLVAQEDRHLEPYLPGQHQLLSLVLVDAETGRVVGLRTVTWSAPASAVLHRELLAQCARAFDRIEHENIVAQVYAQYPTSRDLAQAAVLLERAGRSV